MTNADNQPAHVRDEHRRAYADPYVPLPPLAQPATGVTDPGETELLPEEEPIATGTLFIMIIFLMMIGALWTIVYLMLLDR